MPRKGNVPKREILPDPMYASKVVTKLINKVKENQKLEELKELLLGRMVRN